MSAPVRALGAGLATALVGLVLVLTTGQVHTPVVSLPKVGLVLLVLGAVEVVGTVVWWIGTQRG